MNPLEDLLAAVDAGIDPGPFALLRRSEGDELEMITGSAHTADRLADLPLPAGPAGPRTLAVVPYRQVAERGFACVDDGAPLEYLTVADHRRIPLTEALAALPDRPVAVHDGRFDIADPDYAAAVAAVLADEIGHGEGANFVLHRTFTATLTGAPLATALAALRRLLVGERGAYWTFLVHTGTRTLVGASPERHVSVEDGLVMMNPISGTHRHPDGPADPEALLRFLADPKEIDELYMVLDEELKMMATVAEYGGQVIGPYLKEMSRLTHTEYLLAGQSTRDVREVLRETMFAPTVTGSPMENACRVIARRERRGRRYYAGVLALLGHDDRGRQTLDAPILIRTAEISPTGRVRVPVGATLVRHSTPAGEVAETYAKAAGVLAAFGVAVPAATAGVPATGPDGAPTGPDRPTGATRTGPGDAAPTRRLAELPAVRAALAARNDRLARFWLDQRTPGTAALPELTGRRALVVDGEDTFTGMLAHQLRALGLAVELTPWTALAPVRAEHDLVVVGPGPGDPTDSSDAKMAALRRTLVDLLTAGRPTLAVCLGHQLLCGLLGLRLHRRDAPYQGVRREIDLFGAHRRVGFYSSYTAVTDADRLPTRYGPVEVARDADRGAVHAVRGRGFVGLQFHPESVLSADGFTVLADLLPRLLPTLATSAP
ncbi:anthranilate synthase family protein [Micromonospora zhanjiangensis]|uniref:anthranilate synthase n=1 Tax=Micromonospora zhanjiangensis TaxID=1522057 RepID=A0ABV8KJY1_9ACTN